ncbi:hypothetical protein FOA52_007917 [Chlamydomonas sp. UWO 241]|nr:hypothetical protein FOA52_007917 [Chlamydomonas sp. UWO 241]
MRLLSCDTHVELQQTEEHAWRQHEALTQQSCILTGELEAEVQEHQRMLAEQAAESHRREEQLLREVASLRAALAAQQQQQRF